MEHVDRQDPEAKPAASGSTAAAPATPGKSDGMAVQHKADGDAHAGGGDAGGGAAGPGGGRGDVFTQMQRTLGGGDVQHKKRAGGRAVGKEDRTKEAAAEGVSGAGGALPHADKIQASFGHHDISAVKGHTGPEAAAANKEMGAHAYATGSDVAFAGGAPDLHTAAHEAAHVVQQKAGVSLKGGVGAAGDKYEQHADAVADKVVAGQNAAPLLDQMAPGGASAGAGGVQHKAVQFDIKADLRKAMDGWGTDEDAIFARCERATPAEVAAVLADGALMGELRSELDRGDMERVLDGLHAPVKDKLKLAMSGWGHDADYVHRTLLNATPEELQAVAADAALVHQLQGELSGDDMKRVLDRIGGSLKQKLELAIKGWGTDEAYIFTSVTAASVADITAVANDAALVAKVDSDLSGGELNQFRGLLARRLHQAGNDLLAFQMCKGSDSQRKARLNWIGDFQVARLVCDAAINGSNDGDTVKQAFQSYWEVELSVTEGAKKWPVDVLRAMHRQLKQLPDQDTRSKVWKELQLTGNKDLIDRAAYGGGVFSVGEHANTASNIPMGYGTRLSAPAAVGATSIQVAEGRFQNGQQVVLDQDKPAMETVTISAIAGNTYTISATTKAHGMNATVGMTGGGGLRDVNWLDATVRHEIAHSVEGIVDSGDFKNRIGGWWSGSSFEDWAKAMGNRWGAAVISDDDKKKIEKAIEEYVHGAKGTLMGLPADHPVRKHWGDNVPVIQAAEACLSRGDNFFAAPTSLYQANNKVFTCSKWYKTFQYCNAGVLADRLSDYTLYAPAEFFAETYTVFYEEAGNPGVTDAQLGRHVKNATWADWMRTHVHDRGHAPAGGGGGGGGHGPEPKPAAPAAGAVASTTAGDGHAGGASHGKSAGNPN